MPRCRKKVLVIGLDCLTPQLVFGENLNNLPNIRRLAEKGVWGRMRSTVPPITCPAWMAMMTGKDPGTLGCYGMRNRRDYGYDSLKISTSLDIKEETLWDILSREKKKTVVIGVPQTYPPRKINGFMISGFLTPDTSSEFTYPKELKDEIEREFGDYMIDVRNFRRADKDSILKEIYDLSRQRFRIAGYMLKNKEWDFFMFVDMGPDRLHHSFWKFHDRNHIKHKEGNKYENTIRDYYKFLDKEIGVLLSGVDDNTTVIIVSDHGAKSLDGGFCINEWLIREGYLKLRERPASVKRLSADMVDWKRTVAWGEGGYYGRLFLNVKGREPNGVIEKRDYEKIRNEIRDKLCAVRSIAGRNIDTKAFKPEEVYSKKRNIPPDLIIYFDDLNLRSIGGVGYDDIYTLENDTGPDDANHAQHGVFIMSGGVQSSGERSVSILDIAPTILSRMGRDIPADMQGAVIGAENP